ncbi:unnamed protein product [Arctogadus glacialis]
MLRRETGGKEFNKAGNSMLLFLTLPCVMKDKETVLSFSTPVSSPRCITRLFVTRGNHGDTAALSRTMHEKTERWVLEEVRYHVSS